MGFGEERQILNSLRAAAGLRISCVLVALSNQVSAASAAKVNNMRGNVSAIGLSGETRRLSRGDDINSGDLIATGARSFVSLVFADGSRYALGRNSKFKVERFVYNRSREEDGFVARIFKGAFRFVSGKIAKRRKDAMSARLGAVATIGIRGTSVGGEVSEDGAAQVVLLEPEEAGTSSAIDVFNPHGSVTIDTPGYGTDIADADSAPTPPRRMRLRTVENVVRSVQSIGRIRTAPRPRVR